MTTLPPIESQSAPQSHRPADGLRAALVELERHIRSGQLQSCEHIVAAFPQVAADKESLLELVYTEHAIRQEMGQEVSLDDWLRRFPEWQRDLQQLFQVHDYLSTAPGPATWGEAPTPTFADWTETVDNSDSRLGKYELLEPLGRGGMGVVFRARQLGIDRIVAVKTIHHSEPPTEELLRRFRAEVDTAASLQHPNIVQIFEVGVSGGLPFFSMEYVSGGSLATVIRTHPLPPLTAARWMRCLARAVQYAHDQGVVHRDLKPANILLAPSQRLEAVELDVFAAGASTSSQPQRFEPKITDFGLAKRLNTDSQGTLPGAALGTPSYMAPEQAQHGGHAAGPASDIYSLGAVLYDMLVGRPPFLAATPLETLEAVKREEPPSIRSVQPHVPRDLELICLKCLHKDPARRYRSASDLGDDIDRYLAGRPIAARPAGWGERAAKWSRRHPAAAAFLAALFLGILGVCWQWIRADRLRSLAEQQTQIAREAREEEIAARQRAESTLYARDVSLAHHEYLSNNTDRAARLLEGAPAQYRNWEWDYLRQVCQAELWDWSDLPTSAWCTAITRDGRFVAGGSGLWGTNRDERIHVWNVITGEIAWTFGGQPGSIMDLSFHPDGTLLAAAGVHWHKAQPPGGVRIVSLVDGREIEAFGEWNAFSTSFSPDGRWLAIGDEAGTVHWWPVEGGRTVRSVRAHAQLVLDLAWSPDSSVLASCSRDGTVRLYDEQGALRHSLTGLGDTRRLAWSPDGNELAVGSHVGLVRIFRVRPEGMVEMARLANNDVLGALRFTPDGQSLVMTSRYSSIRFVDPLNGMVQRELHGHNGVTRDVAFDASGMWMASCGSDGHVKVWDLTRAEPPQTSVLAGAHMVAAHFIDERQVAIALGLNTERAGIPFDGQTIRLWDTVSKQIAGYYRGHADWLTSMDMDPHQRLLLTGSLDRTVQVWHARTGEVLRRWGRLEAPVRQVAFLMDGLLAAGLDERGRLFVWPVEEQEPLAIHDFPEGDTPISIAGGHRAPFFAVGFASGKVRLYEVGCAQPLAEGRAPSAPRRLAISPEDVWLATGCESGVLALWRLEVPHSTMALGPDLVIQAHTQPVDAVRFSPEGSRLFSASADTSLRLWDLQSGQQVMSLEGPSSDSCDVAISPAFQRLALTNRTLLSIWDRGGGVRRGFAEIQDDVPYRNQWHAEQFQRARAGQRFAAVVFHFDAMESLGEEVLPNRSIRAGALANLERWQDAKTDYESISIADRTIADESNLALLCLTTGDDGAYRETCRRLAQRLQGGLTPVQINQIVWPMVLAADAGLDPAGLLPWVETMASGDPSADILNTAGALCFRAGHLDRAHSLLTMALDKRTGPESTFDHVFLGMVFHRRGDSQSAAEHLRLAEAWIVDQRALSRIGRPTHPAYTWVTRLELDLLSAEASGELEPGRAAARGPG